MSSPLNLVSATLRDIVSALEDHTVTSHSLVEAYLRATMLSVSLGYLADAIV